MIWNELSVNVKQANNKQICRKTLKADKERLKRINVFKETVCVRNRHIECINY